LRKKTLDLGGNAVIAVDIDYSEIGSLKGMLMVCMAGTAIKIRNAQILGEERMHCIEAMSEMNKRINELSLYNVGSL